MNRSVRRLVAGAGVAATLLLSGPAARAQDSDADLRKELERTKEQVRELLKRVEQLEGGAKSATSPAAGGDVARAVEDYLAARGAGNVSAPGARSLRFSGHIDAWWERWDRSYRPTDPGGDDVQDVGWLRTSLRADADITKTLRAAVEIRDARYFGQEPSTITQLQTPGAGLDLKEGWLEADDFLGSGTRLRFGRQVLSYGDERLLGAFNWNTYGRSFDGAVFTRLFGNTKVDAIFSRLVENGQAPAGPGIDLDDTNLYGLYTTTPKAIHHSDLDVYVLGLTNGMETTGETGAPGTTRFYTAGLRLVGAKDNMDWGMEVAGQRGTVSGDRLQAMAAHARTGYTMADTAWTPRIGLEWNLATGDHDPTNGRVGTFQNLFPTNHDKYGILDLMAWRNMQDMAASVRVKPAKAWTVTAAWHLLRLEEGADAWYAASGAVIRPGGPGLRGDLGQEVDLVFSWKAEDHMRIDFGGAQFFDGDFVKDSGPGGDALWLYFRVVVSF